MHDNTHAHYLQSLTTMFDAPEDQNWLFYHTRNYLEQHSVHTDDYQGQRIHILDDQSAVVARPSCGYDVFKYHADEFPQVRFGPSPEERARWQHETFTNQDYAGIQDLTQELRDALRKTAAAYNPGSRNRNDFLETLKLVESAHRRITYKNGCPVSKWIDWIEDRRFWLAWNRKDGRQHDPLQQAHLNDVEAMLAVVGPMPD